MPFTYDTIADRVKNDVGSYQLFNRLLNNFGYLKQQVEVMLAEDATELDDDVVKPKHMVASNEAEAGQVHVADSTETGTWTVLWDDEIFRFMAR